MEFQDRPAKERIIGVLSAIRESLPIANIARYAQASTEEVLSRQ